MNALRTHGVAFVSAFGHDWETITEHRTINGSGTLVLTCGSFDAIAAQQSGVDYGCNHRCTCMDYALASYGDKGITRQ